jgi:GTP cyclohydrolase I
MPLNLTNERFAAEEAVRTLIRYIGDNPDRPGLQDTPQRFLKAWRESWGAGYADTPGGLLKLFPDEYNSGKGDAMIIVQGIEFYSTCEHHLAPFYGTADIAYIPSDRGLLGLSKLARITNFFARRLQVQERLTNEVADFIAMNVAPDVGVIMRASHMCMVSRGVQQPGAMTITSALRGTFFHDLKCRAEFLQLSGRK